ncbi:hypothetical protein [Clostridium sp. AF32-12BH]|uniref:hypothetical protein n=1 Tax=Clostridium sp. AF32-12BH TaxID=2292006 RepID=UPI000E51CB13|nr:hypothetical protein [Clostridium sp. AF32-12BH]RHP47024.1 hypothetical protein DWZ40_08960 [Clostridium sp. AF32-12BH]
MKSNGYEYVMKSAAVFRKAHKMPEHKEKRVTVFLDASMLAKSDLPEEVVNNAIMSANNDRFGLTRLENFCMCAPVIGKDGLKYCIDLESETYTICNEKTGKPIYSVICVTGYRYAAYKADIYGYYSGLPVKSHSEKWRTELYWHMFDLYYTEEAENTAIAY